MTHIRQSSKILLILVIFFLSAQTQAKYQKPYEQAGCWKNTFGIYSWIFAQQGDMRIRGNTVNVDVTVGNVLRNLNLIDFILQAHMETSNGIWSFFVNPTILKVSHSLRQELPGPLPDIKVKASIASNIIDFSAAYSFYDRCFRNGCSSLKLELCAGGRNVYFASDVKLNQFNKVDDAANWLGFLMGIRATCHVTPSIDLWTRLDASYSSSSHSFGWALLSSYAFTSTFKVLGGVRAIDFCGKDGSGQNRFVMDVTYIGPVLGAALNW